MCGIFGINRTSNKEFINKFVNLQKHRGPDGSNYFLDENLTLIHNRLSILDHEFGSQPMRYENLIVVFNGEIFNSPELRKILEREGYNFTSKNSDTEVLIKMFHFKGINMLNDLNGMYSFVIYNQKEKKLFGAVDKFSIKPMYFLKKGKNFAFASELRTLLNLDIATKQLDRNSLYKYFNFQYVPGIDTIYKDVKKIGNYNYFVFDLTNNTMEIKSYRKINQNCDFFKSYEEAVLEGKLAIEKSVKNWMLSDVPIICSLSGGLDSSLIASIFSKNSNKKIRTISVGFTGEDSEYDERNHAKKLARFIDSDHSEIIVKPNQILEDMDEIFNYLNEPYAGSLASWYIYKNIKDQKVIFTGTGADELFGNYGKWKNYTFSDVIIKNLIKSFKENRLKDFKYPHGLLYKKFFTNITLSKLLKKNWRSNININKFIDDLKDKGSKNPKKIIQNIDWNLQLPWEFLYITDRLSMINSVEARTPFLDNEMLQYHSKLNPKFNGTIINSKKLLKDIAKYMIPNDIIHRSKMGFVLPKENWLKKNLYSKLKSFCSKNYLDKQEIFEYEGVKRMLEDFETKPGNNVEKIWTFFIFQFWYEKFN